MHHSVLRRNTALAAATALCVTLTACGGDEEPVTQVIRGADTPGATETPSPTPAPLPEGQVPQVADVPPNRVAVEEGTGMVLPDRAPVGSGVSGSGRVPVGVSVEQVEAMRTLWNTRKAVARSLDGAGCTAEPDGVWAAVRPMKGGGDAMLLGTWEGSDTILCTVGNARVVVQLDNREVLGDAMFASLIVS